MINALTALSGEFQKECADSALGCKILATALAYGFDPRFAQFWAGNGIYGLWGGVVTLTGNLSDAEEAVAFLRQLHPQGVLCSGENAALLGLKPLQEGCVMTKDPTPCIPKPLNPGFFEETKVVFDLLKRQKMGHSYKDFCLDFTHRYRRGLAAAALVYQGDTLAACALCAYLCPDAALITAVAADPDCTRQGYGSRAVIACEKLLAGRRLFLLKEEKKNDAFYRGLGYHGAGHWVYGNISNSKG